jgi:hypothetical protein
MRWLMWSGFPTMSQYPAVSDRVRTPSAAQIRLLQAAAQRNTYVDHLSDGQLRWAFLFDFSAAGSDAIAPGAAGAIAVAEAGVGVLAAALYSHAAELSDAWFQLQSVPAACSFGHQVCVAAGSSTTSANNRQQVSRVP